jgi:hypothetical protein
MCSLEHYSWLRCQSFQFKLFGLQTAQAPAPYDRRVSGSGITRSPCIGATIVCLKRHLPKAKLQAHLAKLRNATMSHWKVVGSQSVQAITDRLYLAWEAFFRGDIKRPPTFRKRFALEKSRLYPGGGAVFHSPMALPHCSRPSTFGLSDNLVYGYYAYRLIRLSYYRFF